MADYIEVKKALSILNDLVNDCTDKEDFYNLAFDEIDKASAADVVPVVHGRWIRFKEPDSETGYIHMRCSVCTAYWSDPSHADHFRYCPNCGAKMDGERISDDED